MADSTPYPWPWNGQFAADRCALLVLDTAQPPVPSGDPAWTVVDSLAASLAARGGLIVSVGTGRPPRLTTPSSRMDGPGAPARFDAHVTVTAPGWDGFFATNLDSVLRGSHRDLLLLVGGWLEIGVHSTMRSANDRGYECLLIPDACIAIDATTRAATVSSTEMSGGIFGAVAESRHLIDLLESTTH
jgi:nicotinamidase-related amidase